MALTENNKTAQEIEQDVIDIDLTPIRKKQIRINGDNTRILELNISDLNILNRLKEKYPQLNASLEKVMSIGDLDVIAENEENPLESDTYKQIIATLKDADNEMRDALDYIFDSNVSEVCAPNGTMYDVVGGKYRYEHILEVLMKLYETNISEEYKRMQARVQRHTAKYSGKARKK